MGIKKSSIHFDLGNKGPQKVLNGTKLILDDHSNNLDSFRIRLESFRSFVGPLLLKPVTGQELFFAVSYSKPALTLFSNWLHFTFAESFSELIQNISDVPISETFFYFTEIKATTWSINKIIPVYIALFRSKSKITLLPIHSAWSMDIWFIFFWFWIIDS